VFALDVPSGMHSDTGVTLGVAVRADVTITFGHPKTGLLTSLGADAAGSWCSRTWACRASEGLRSSRARAGWR
jgi:hypothetical protein